MTPIDICGALLAAIIPADSVPELRDDDVRNEVMARLSEVGCELIYSHHHDAWTARLTGPLPDVSLTDSPHALDTKDLAVLAACWLHLRFLPMENSRLPLDDDGLFADDDTSEGIPLDEAELASNLVAISPTTIGIALGKLKRLRFLDQRNGQLFAGPMLDALDEIRATEQARRLMLRHQRLSRLADETVRPTDGTKSTNSRGGTANASD